MVGADGRRSADGDLVPSTDPHSVPLARPRTSLRRLKRSASPLIRIAERRPWQKPSGAKKPISDASSNLEPTMPTVVPCFRKRCSASHTVRDLPRRPAHPHLRGRRIWLRYHRYPMVLGSKPINSAPTRSTARASVPANATPECLGDPLTGPFPPSPRTPSTIASPIGKTCASLARRGRVDADHERTCSLPGRTTPASVCPGCKSRPPRYS